VIHLRKQVSVRPWIAILSWSANFISTREVDTLGSGRKGSGKERQKEGEEAGRRTLLNARLLRLVDDELLQVLLLAV